MDKGTLLNLVAEDQDWLPVAMLRGLKIEISEDLDTSLLKMGVFHNLLLKEYIEKREQCN